MIQVFDPVCRNIHTSKGVDILEYFLEIKSQASNTSSALTVGSLTATDILKTSFFDSILRDKLQAHLYVTHDGIKVTDVHLHYYDNQVYYNLFEKSYIESQNKLQSILDSRQGMDQLLGLETYFRKYFKPYQSLKINNMKYGYFERNQNNTGFNFRIPKAGKKIVQTIANSTYTDLFI